MGQALPLDSRSAPPRAGLPNLWLELRPTRAFAAQPRIDAAARHADARRAGARRASSRARPSPTARSRRQLEIVPPLEQGRVNIAVPIDVPFTEVNRLIEAQLTGKTFPQDKSSALAVRCAAPASRLPATGC